MCEGAPSFIKIIHERYGCACKFSTILFFNNDAYYCPVIKHINRHLALNLVKKYGPKIKNTANPHHTVTFSDYNVTCKVEHRFSSS